MKIAANALPVALPVALAVALTLLIALPAQAGNGKFAGNWKKNVEDTAAAQPTPGSEVPAETMVVSVEGEELTVDRTVQSPEQGELKVKFTYKDSDAPYEIPALTGPPRVVTTKWSGNKLVVKFDRKFPNGMDGSVVETWKMKGKQLEIKYSARAPVGTFVSKHYYDRVN